MTHFSAAWSSVAADVINITSLVMPTPPRAKQHKRGIGVMNELACDMGIKLSVLLAMLASSNSRIDD